jgi:hypothetical protein
MSFELNVAPGQTVTWEQFLEKPACSIALDGFCASPTRHDLRGPHANFDHHHGSGRAATLSTCAQVYEAINTGMLGAFGGRHSEEVNLKLWVNDCDHDVCLSVYLLRNYEQVEGGGTPTLNRLVACVDKMDRHAGVYPLKGHEIIEEMAWIFEPYDSFRAGREHGLHAMEHTIELIEGRIAKHLLSRGERRNLEGCLRVVDDDGSSPWVLIEETGPAARWEVARKGLTAFVSSTPFPDGTFRHVLWRRAWAGVDLNLIYPLLNEEEPPLPPGTQDLWGGSDEVGGSPRGRRSVLPPGRVLQIVREFDRRGR